MDQKQTLKKSVYKKWWFWGLVIVIFAVLISFISDDDPQNGTDGSEGTEIKEEAAEDADGDTKTDIEDTEAVNEDTGTNNEDTSEKTVEDDSVQPPSETEGRVVEETVEDNTLSRDNSSAVLTTLNTGKFKVGTDIPEGRYVITGDNSGNLIISDKDEMPYVNEIMGTGEFGVDQVTTNIKEGDTIEISGINKATFAPAETKLQTDTLTTGNWVVGIDLAAGRYDITSTEGSGNLFVYDESGWPEVNEILGGEYGVEKVTANLENGFTISISGLKEIKLEIKK